MVFAVRIIRQHIDVTQFDMEAFLARSPLDDVLRVRAHSLSAFLFLGLAGIAAAMPAG
jgi:hypothetical protein